MQKISKIVPIVSQNSDPLPGRALSVSGGRHPSWLQRLSQRFEKWRQIRKSRKALSEMTEAQLRDIGLSRAEANREYRRSRYIG